MHHNVKGSLLLIALLAAAACDSNVSGPATVDSDTDNNGTSPPPGGTPIDDTDPPVNPPDDPPVDPRPSSELIVAALTATRLEGPAPLAVLFDATGTTATGVDLPFHNLQYAFDFGDDRGASWATSNRPKNTQTGAPLAAHVFDNPGTYTVRLLVTGVDDEEEEVSVRVVVTDPASAFATTVCVSPSSNFTGCPSGATQATSLPSPYAGKRVLLHRGEQFGSINLQRTDDNVLVSTYGTGAKPRVGSISLGGDGRVAGWPDEVTFVDLNVARNFYTAVTASRVLVYRCDFVEPDEEKVDFGSSMNFWLDNGELPANAYYWPHEIFLVESQVIGDTNGNGIPNVDVMGSLASSALLGNTINRATEHSLRLWHMNKSVIAHNAIGGEHYAGGTGGIGIRHALKVHSAGTSPYSDNVGTSTRNVSSSKNVTADNTFGSATYPGSWLTAFGPQNSDAGTIEGLEDVIQERDRFIRGPTTTLEIRNVVRRGNVRGATLTNGGAIRIDQVRSDQWSGNAAMRPWCGPYLGLTDTD